MGHTSRDDLVLHLFERYYERVYCFARRSVDGSTAEDIAQEVFTRLLDHEGLEKKTISVSYLIKIADNLIKRRYRRRRRQEEFISEQRAAAGAETMPVQTPGRDENESRDAKATDNLRYLNQTEEDAVRLIVCRGLSYEQAARALGVKVTAVNNWKFRGIQRLRQHVGPEHSGRRTAAEDRFPGRTGRGAFGQRSRSGGLEG
ncbi:MAG: sigma-70 family RNA polymerase sigma factor [Planctomycetota bacterium]